MRYFDVLDENGKFSGIIKTREDIHRDGDWHGAVHVWIINSKKQILIKKRPNTKDINPGKWDASSGGHIIAGDDTLSAAIRETKEKLDIDLLEKNLKFLFSRKDHAVSHDGRFIDNEISDVFITKLDINEKKLKLNVQEAVEIRFMDFDEFRDKILGNDPAFVIRHNEFLEMSSMLPKLFKINLGTK